jgi:hypothetical protein
MLGLFHCATLSAPTRWMSARFAPCIGQFGELFPVSGHFSQKALSSSRRAFGRCLASLFGMPAMFFGGGHNWALGKKHLPLFVWFALCMIDEAANLRARD